MYDAGIGTIELFQVGCYIAAGLVTLAGGYWLWCSLIGLRLHSSRHCPKCWYDMSSTVSMQCSECGCIARTERALHKRRRRRTRFVFACLTFLAAWVVTLMPVGVRDGWRAAVPTWTLVLLGPNLSDVDEQLEVELAHRAYSQGLAAWQWRYLGWRCLDDDPPWEIDIKARARWPIGVPIYADVSARGTRAHEYPWFEKHKYIERMRITGLPEGADTYVDIRQFGVLLCGGVGGDRPVFPYYVNDKRLIHPGIDKGEKAVVSFDVGIREFGRMYSTNRRFPSSDMPFRLIIRMAEEIEFTPVADVHEILTPVELDTDTLREGLTASLSDGVIVLGYLHPFGARPNEHCTFAAHVEIVCDGEVVASRSIWVPSIGHLRHEVAFDELSDLTEAIDLNEETWTVRLTGNPEIAICDFQSTRYWRGSIEIPLLSEMPKSRYDDFAKSAF